MRLVSASEITRKVAELCMHANYNLNDDIVSALQQARTQEEDHRAQEVLGLLLQNADVARLEHMAICQDTGMAVVFMELGQEVHVVDGDLEAAVNEGVRQGYQQGYLRKSTAHPITRVNIGDNTPAILHLRMVSGDQIKITVAPKGFGSENMGGLFFLKPGDGVKGIYDVVLETVRKAGGNPCPPMIIGVGIGGTMEHCTYLAKKALLRHIGSYHSDLSIASMEKELLNLVNQTNIGPQGFGGKTTALFVAIEISPTHIAGLPVAVNIGCHATRHKTDYL